ncbi:hypothetical protein QA584_23760 [Anaerocolumna sp. AGMB13025]|uniref:hypothetical protein n=1 Tax=Anaerocolumna sp. AGMB13025 TaxID=3039116 RepID=UPI00241C7145|nr:hypothetical protein [Anaerocolumna sp. AGMB13025]WFR56600.1 hypothetical protein QA584_23760 [Anaerocolumna sp. AGMB13025]
MRNKDYWEKFSKTGNILDYLNYTACTVEELNQLLSIDDEEGGYSDDSNLSDGNGFVDHAYWGL